MAFPFPASTVTGSGIPSSLAIYYDRKSIANLLANTPYHLALTKKPIPANSGKTIQLQEWSLSVFGADTTAATEGTPPTALTPTATSLQATLATYSDAITLSKLISDTTIMPIVTELSELMGYKAALSVNALSLAALESAVAADATLNFVQPAGSYMTSSLLRQRVADLINRNAVGYPELDGQFYGFTSPLVLQDLFSDTANNGVVDVLKRNPEGQRQLLDATPTNANYRQAGSWAGVTMISTTTAPTYANTPTTGDTAYGFHICAQDCAFAVTLGGNEVPEDRNYKAIVTNFTPSLADPVGEVASAVAYRFNWTSAIRPIEQAVERIQTEVSAT